MSNFKEKKLSEDKMEKVAGGKMFNKIVSSFLVAALMGAGGSSVSFAESSKITEKQSIKVSSKKAKTVETVFKTIKDNKGKTTFTAILGSFLGLIGINQVGTKKEIIENVEPDLWFEKLGGTKKDIDDYVTNLNRHNQGKYDQDKYSVDRDQNKIKQISNGLGTIENDVPRINLEEGNVEIAKINEENILPRILKLAVLEEIPYMQGFSYIAGMIILKFLGHDNAKGYSDQKLKEEEAKIYYVYKKITRLLCGLYREFIKYPSLFNHTNLNYMKKDFKALIDNSLLVPWITAGFTRSLKQPHLVKFWDNVILKSDFNAMYGTVFMFLKACLEKIEEGFIKNNKFGHDIVEQAIFAKKFLKEINDETFNELLNKSLK